MQSLDDFCSKIEKFKSEKEDFEIASFTTKIDNIKSPFTFIDVFSNIKQFPRMYWSNITDKNIVGLGCTREFVSNKFEYTKLDDFITSIRTSTISNCDNQEMLKVFGGIAFNQIENTKHSSDIWAKFPNTYFFLPKMIVSNLEGEVLFTFNLDLTKIRSELVKGEIKKQIVQIESDIANLPNNLNKLSLIPIEKQVESQSLEQWKENITKIKILIENSPLEKLVLANSKILHLSEAINVNTSLDYLHESYPNAYKFAIEIEESNIFLSATPELLVHKSKDKLKSDALAGSRPRGVTLDEDLKLENDLLFSNKDRREHKFVVDQILKKLRDAGVQTINPDEPYVVKLKNIQHLKAEINAISNQSAPQLIQVLHPTAAVGGVPSEQALEIISSLEKTNRGWYASPVGWINCEGTGKFVVAIRSALVKGQKAVLYAGAGIVSDSDADAEWEEIDVKFQPMLKALGVGKHNS